MDPFDVNDIGSSGLFPPIYDNDIPISTLTDSLKQSWSGEGKEKLDASMSKANNGSTSIAFYPFLQSDNNDAELTLSHMGGLPSSDPFNASLSFGKTFRDSNTRLSQNSISLSYSMVIPDAGSKRQSSQDLSQFRDKTLDARSSTIRTDSIRFPIPGDNFNDIPNGINDIPNGINDIRHDYPQQSYPMCFPQSYIPNACEPPVATSENINVNLIPDGEKTCPLPQRFLSQQSNPQPYQNYPTQPVLSVQQPFIPTSDTSYEYKAPTIPLPTPPPPLSSYIPTNQGYKQTTNPVPSYAPDPYQMGLPYPYYSLNELPSNPVTVNPSSSFSVASGSPRSYASGSPRSYASGSPGSVGSRRRRTVEGKKKEVLEAYVQEGDTIVKVTSECIKMKKAKESRKWTPEEDKRLLEAVHIYGDHNWVEVAKYVGTRNNSQVSQRYNKVLKTGIKKGPWSSDEDAALKAAFAIYGDDWNEVSKQIPGRSAAKCRERYNHYIGPDVKKGNWTPEEDNHIIQLQDLWGNRWALIANSDKLKGRPANDVRTRFNTLNRMVYVM